MSLPKPEVPGYASPRAALFGGIGEALRAPAWVLGASYVGFGSLVKESGLGLGFGVASTVAMWALPGQIVLVELLGLGASALAIVAAVSLTAVRFLPMTVTLLPLLRRPGLSAWRFYVTAHLIAVTNWAISMKRCPELPPGQRLAFFIGLAATLWMVTILCTAIGFFLAGSVPEAVSLGFVFLNPIYFTLLFASDVRQRSRLIALALGGVLGPVLHLASPDWGLLVTGVVAGSVAYLGDHWLQRHWLPARHD